MRDIENIDGELRLLARAWRVARELCDRMPSTAHIDRLLDERAAALSPLGGNGNIFRRARMRDLEVIDCELRLLLAIRKMAREADGRSPNTARIDALLDERSATLVLSTTVGPA
jgi:hypothetical protein